jgi:putative transcriptional regulator
MKKRKGNTMPISIKLKEILKERDLSQRELARMTGLRPNTISHLCSDNVDRVYLSTLETVCKVLDIDIQELIEVE